MCGLQRNSLWAQLSHPLTTARHRPRYQILYHCFQRQRSPGGEQHWHWSLGWAFYQIQYREQQKWYLWVTRKAGYWTLHIKNFNLHLYCIMYSHLHMTHVIKFSKANDRDNFENNKRYCGVWQHIHEIATCSKEMGWGIASAVKRGASVLSHIAFAGNFCARSSSKEGQASRPRDTIQIGLRESCCKVSLLC